MKYNPSKPSEAMFEKDETSLILYFIGGVFAIVGLFVTGYGIKMAIKQN